MEFYIVSDSSVIFRRIGRRERAFPSYPFMFPWMGRNICRKGDRLR